MFELKNTNMSLKEALDFVSDGETICLENKTYYEKIDLYKKNITLIGQENTKISYNAFSGMIIPKEFLGDGVLKYSTTTSSTFRVHKGADGFKAFGITFENSYKRENNTDGQAVAFKSEANDLMIDNCRFIGEQDTLYIDSGKNNKITSSYIEGDIDFIFGSADCTFNNCEIVGLNKEIVYFTAPSTYVDNKKGFHFKYCNFKTNAINSYLGRAWYPKGAKKEVYPKLILKKCKIEGNVVLDLIQMHENDPRKYELRINNSLLNNNEIDINIIK